MKQLFNFLIIVLLISISPISCTTNSNKAKSEIDNFDKASLDTACEKLQKLVDEEKYAGISVMVVKDNETVLKRNFGYADLENKKPIEDNTIFRIYSMTKPITTAALMTLYDEGKFQLDDELAKYIPEFENTQVYNPETKELEPQKNKITIRHLLTHTAGFTYGWDQNAYVDSL